MSNHWKPKPGEFVRTKEDLNHTPGASSWKKPDELIIAGTLMMVHRWSPGSVVILTFPNRKKWEVPAQIHDLDRLSDMEQLAAASLNWEDYDQHRRDVAMVEMARRLYDYAKRIEELERECAPCTCRSGICYHHDG